MTQLEYISRISFLELAHGDRTGRATHEVILGRSPQGSGRTVFGALNWSYSLIIGKRV